jgi:predicted small lipoprotein YifL
LLVVHRGTDESALMSRVSSGSSLWRCAAAMLRLCVCTRCPGIAGCGVKGFLLDLPGASANAGDTDVL